MKSKKGDGNVVLVVVVIALALIFLVIYLAFTSKGFGKGFKTIDDQIDSSNKDTDSDGVIDRFDKCKDDPKNLPGCDAATQPKTT